MLVAHRKTQTDRQTNKILRVAEKRKTAECGGGEYLAKWDNGEHRWVNKLKVQNMMKRRQRQYILKHRNL
eukprot:13114-Pleurochrysis_carterae.AAC.1